LRVEVRRTRVEGRGCAAYGEKSSSLEVLIEVLRSKVFIRKKQSTAGDGKSAMGHFTRQGRATNRANACRLVVARSASDPRCRFPASVLFAGGNGNPLSSGRHKWSAERASTKDRASRLRLLTDDSHLLAAPRYYFHPTPSSLLCLLRRD